MVIINVDMTILFSIMLLHLLTSSEEPRRLEQDEVRPREHGLLRGRAFDVGDDGYDDALLLELAGDGGGVRGGIERIADGEQAVEEHRVVLLVRVE
jgi:hypothetical protein